MKKKWKTRGGGRVRVKRQALFVSIGRVSQPDGPFVPRGIMVLFSECGSEARKGSLVDKTIESLHSDRLVARSPHAGGGGGAGRKVVCIGMT